ncbi:MAG TPA: PAS domain S-box protein [Terriglobales bacterium]|nr:PAS domain S-box protein [Terriglobales bacterium]
MNDLEVLQSTESFYRAILNSIPLPIFLVDEELKLHELNEAARHVFGLDGEIVLQQRGGDVLHCLHASETPQGCGHASSCSDCVIRNSVLSSLAGKSVHRRRMKFKAVNGDRKRELELLVTVSPVPGSATRTLLILEDITELTLLKSIIPICMHCKKVRDDRHYWQQVEGYFHRFIGVEFSHGVCPECMEQHYGNLRS